MEETDRYYMSEEKKQRLKEYQKNSEFNNQYMI